VTQINDFLDAILHSFKYKNRINFIAFYKANIIRVRKWDSSVDVNKTSVCFRCSCLTGRTPTYESPSRRIIQNSKLKFEF
jgi:hypothetical protein